MERALFLDIDGVLNSHRFEKSEGFYFSAHGLEIDPQVCKKLSETLQKLSPITIVIISDWRNQISLSQIQEVLKDFNLQVNAVIESSPCTKSQGIEKFLKTHQPKKIAILDDDQLFDLHHPLHPFQIKTSLYSGLLPQHLDLLAEMFS